LCFCKNKDEALKSGLRPPRRAGDLQERKKSGGAAAADFVRAVAIKDLNCNVFRGISRLLNFGTALALNNILK
jgi:hypothetical protein